MTPVMKITKLKARLLKTESFIIKKISTTTTGLNPVNNYSLCRLAAVTKEGSRE